jgi:hypothetical protein
MNKHTAFMALGLLLVLPACCKRACKTQPREEAREEVVAFQVVERDMILADADLPIDKEGYDSCTSDEFIVRRHTTQYERNMRHEVEEMAEQPESRHRHYGHVSQRERALEDEMMEHPCEVEEALEEVCS